MNYIDCKLQKIFASYLDRFGLGMLQKLKGFGFEGNINECLPYKFYVLAQIGLSKQGRPRSDCF